jgi:hypothetical protein
LGDFAKIFGKLLTYFDYLCIIIIQPKFYLKTIPIFAVPVFTALYKRHRLKYFPLPSMRLIKGWGSNRGLALWRGFFVQRSIMQSGNFYFISDDYFRKFEGNNLMPNKEDGENGTHGRPCFYSFKGKDSKIMWMIPISSQINKFEKIYNERIKKYKLYDGIKFGFVLGKRKAFLIQNMCPVTEKYIINEYIDKATNKPVVIGDSLKNELNASARKAVRLYRQGIKIVFANILEIEKILLTELAEE